jgi:hypothetical protein
MQILKHLKKNIDFKDVRALGVSKTCCQKCADQLEKEKIHYSAWSEVNQIGEWWKALEVIFQMPETITINL